METIKSDIKESMNSAYGEYGNILTVSPDYQSNNNKPWVNFEHKIGIERSTNIITITDIPSSIAATAGFVPATPLGKKLLALRENAIAEGMELLNEDEILEEVKRRRGEEYADVY